MEDKARDMGKSSATGSFQLLIGVVGSTIILALGTLILGWLLTRDQLGLYGVALIPASMINFFRDWGVNSAMTKQIASLRAAGGKEAEIHDVIVSGIIFEVISGAIMSLVCFGLANMLASFLKMPEAATLISVMSLSIFAGALIAAASAIFVGFEKMKFNSLIIIVEAVVKTALGPLLVIVGYSVLGAIVGSVVSFVAGAAVALAIVYVAMFRPIRKLKTGKCDVRRCLRPMLSYGLPLTISNTVVGVMPLLFAFLMAPIAGTALMGDYYAANYFTVILTFFTIPISTALFPAFAKVNAKNEPELLKTVFASSVKYTSVIVVPATIVIMALSSPIVNTLWPQKFLLAPMFLTLSVIINLYVAVGNVSLGTFMTGLGETRWLMLQSLLSLACSAPLVAFMIAFPSTLTPMMGVIVGIIGILFSTLPGMVWGLIWVAKRYKVKADFGSSARILISSVVAGIVAYLTASLGQPYLNTLGLSFWVSTVISLVVGFGLFLGMYLLLAPLTGAVNQADVTNIREMFSGLGIVSRVLEIPLKFMEKPLKMKTKAAKQTPATARAAPEVELK
jgi:stage V sporulation protein B